MHEGALNSIWLHVPVHILTTIKCESIKGTIKTLTPICHIPLFLFLFFKYGAIASTPLQNLIIYVSLVYMHK